MALHPLIIHIGCACNLSNGARVMDDWSETPISCDTAYSFTTSDYHIVMESHICIDGVEIELYEPNEWYDRVLVPLLLKCISFEQYANTANMWGPRIKFEIYASVRLSPDGSWLDVDLLYYNGCDAACIYVEQSKVDSIARWLARVTGKTLKLKRISENIYVLGDARVWIETDPAPAVVAGFLCAYTAYDDYRSCIAIPLWLADVAIRSLVSARPSSLTAYIGNLNETILSIWAVRDTRNVYASIYTGKYYLDLLELVDIDADIQAITCAKKLIAVASERAREMKIDKC